MANKLAENLRVKPIEELQSSLLDLKKELLRLRFKNAYGQLENPMEIRKSRKQIARIITVLKEKGTKV
ncbi:MAG: 50S ribosomal protein L29 [Nitrospiraceae bacterium]|nr:50S ribosomal protein L29 [Nitrospiraceae bacterium]